MSYNEDVTDERRQVDRIREQFTRQTEAFLVSTTFTDISWLHGNLNIWRG